MAGTLGPAHVFISPSTGSIALISVNQVFILQFFSRKNPIQLGSMTFGLDGCNTILFDGIETSMAYQPVLLPKYPQFVDVEWQLAFRAFCELDDFLAGLPRFHPILHNDFVVDVKKDHIRAKISLPLVVWTRFNSPNCIIWNGRISR